MTQETYRLAYEEANAELQQINEQFERLRVRREKVQQVVDALRPLFADGELPVAVAAASSEAAPFLVQQASMSVPMSAPMSTQMSASMSTPEPAPAEAFPEAPEESEAAFAAEQSSDPFQRRIDNALRHGLGSRDAKILPRGLNGLLSRA